MGDVLMATPAIIALKEKFPSARITVGVKEANRSLISLPKIVDRVVGLDAPWVVTTVPPTRWARWVSLLRKMKELRKQKFDLAIDFKGDLRNIILLSLTGSKERVSYGIRGGGFLLTRRVKYVSGIRHEIDRNLDIVRDIAGDVERVVPRYQVSPADEAEYEKKFSGLFLPNQKFIGIHPGANSPSKRWPLSSFAELAKRIKKNDLGKVYLFTGPNENEKDFDEIRSSSYKLVSMPVDVPLDILAVEFKKLDLFIGNDSGPFHLAEAVGTKVITIFGGTFPEIVGPVSKDSEVIRSKKPSCGHGRQIPCRQPGEKEKCKDAECLKEISVDEVYEVVKKNL